MEIKEYINHIYKVEVSDEYSYIQSMYNSMQLNFREKWTSFPKLFLTNGYLDNTVLISYKNNDYILISLEHYKSFIMNEFLFTCFQNGSDVLNINFKLAEDIIVGYLVMHECSHSLLSRKEIFHYARELINLTTKINYLKYHKPYIYLFNIYYQNNEVEKLEEIACDFIAYWSNWAYFVFGHFKISPRQHSLLLIAFMKILYLSNLKKIKNYDINFSLVRESLIQFQIIDNLENSYMSIHFYNYSENTKSNKISMDQIEKVENLTHNFSLKYFLPYLHFINKEFDTVINEILNDTVIGVVLKNSNINFLLTSDLKNNINRTEYNEYIKKIDTYFLQFPFTFETHVEINEDTRELESFLDNFLKSQDKLNKFIKIFRNKYLWQIQ